MANFALAPCARRARLIEVQLRSRPDQRSADRERGSRRHRGVAGFHARQLSARGVRTTLSSVGCEAAPGLSCCRFWIPGPAIAGKIQAWQTCIAVELQTPLRIAYRLGRDPRCLCACRIRLVELHEDGSLRSVPWREESVQETLKQVRQEQQRLPAIDGPFNAVVGPPIPSDWRSAGDQLAATSDTTE